MGTVTQLMGKTHGQVVHQRRVRVLRDHLLDLLPERGSVLDVGCGDGLLDRLIMDAREGLEIRGVDVLVRPETHIDVTPYDGMTLPFADGAFDMVMVVDVLHHTHDPLAVLKEVSRVAARRVVIKDHVVQGLAAWTTLRFMDWVGNAPSGVALPYHYWTMRQWEDGWREAGLKLATMRRKLGLYPAPANWVFGRSLHMVAALEKA